MHACLRDALTWMPETVKYGISNLTVIGGLSFLSSSFETDGSPKCARIRYSFPPWNCLIVQTIASLSGAYLTEPIEVLKEGVSASGGTGMTISTLLAVERCLNCDFALIMYLQRNTQAKVGGERETADDAVVCCCCAAAAAV